MNKSESKYFNTALCMDDALISLLEEKELEYITVKEICKKAGVNRSTFYLHYETVADLVNEAIENINKHFLSYFTQSTKNCINEIQEKELKDLIFITQDYLQPYLQFIYDHRSVYRAAFRSPCGMQVDIQYQYLKRHVLEPILQRFEIPDRFRQYYIAYYISGITAIIKEWLDQGCKDSVKEIAALIEICVRPSHGAEKQPYRESCDP